MGVRRSLAKVLYGAGTSEHLIWRGQLQSPRDWRCFERFVQTESAACNGKEADAPMVLSRARF
jgi:hypothetical protein